MITNAEIRAMLESRARAGYSLLAFDSETYPILAGNKAPKSVVWSLYDGDRATLADPASAVDVLGQTLADESIVHVAHNLAFDLAVLAREAPHLLGVIWRAVREGRVRCTQIRQRLIDLSYGDLEGFDPITRRPYRYRLSDLVQRHLGVDISASKGPDAWRTRYHELDGVPFEQWPTEATEYVLDDARLCYLVHDAQVGSTTGVHWIEADPTAVLDEVRQVRTAFVLQLSSVWGMRTDAASIDALERELHEQVDKHRAYLVAAGVVSPRGKRKMKVIEAMVVEAYADADGVLPDEKQTPTGRPKTDTDTLLESGHGVLSVLGEISKPTYHLNSTIPKLRLGIEFACTPSIFTVKETGRVSYADPNLQNLPARARGDATVYLYRRCFVPRVGYVYVAADFGQCELVCLASECLDLLGYSLLADAINAGVDVHCMLGATMEQVPLESFDRHDKGPHELARDVAKVGNFGLPGGMGVDKFTLHARKQGLRWFTRDDSVRVKRAWIDTWQEMPDYLGVANSVASGSGVVVQSGSGRIRGGCRYTQAANTRFQGRAADLMFDAVERVAHACYLEPDSPLFESRVVASVHDEIILEVPEDRIDGAGRELVRHMLAAAEFWCPRVRMSVDVAAMRVWDKRAKGVYDEAGRLIPWSLEK